MIIKRIEELRISNGYTQKDVADQLGLCREVYRRYEKGIRSLPVECLIKLAALYGRSTDYILGLED